MSTLCMLQTFAAADHSIQGAARSPGDFGTRIAFHGGMVSYTHLSGCAALSCLSFLVLACGAPYPGEEPVSRVPLHVIGGSPSGPELDPVVFLRAMPDDNPIWQDCTGTLVSPRVVLTARHCVSAVQPGPFVCGGDGELVHDGSGAGVFGAPYPPDSISVHVGTVPNEVPAARGQQVFATTSSSACRDDFAAVVLDTPVAMPYFPPIRIERPTQQGETVLLVGYGLGERQGLIERWERDEVRIAEVGSDAANPNGSSITPPRTFTVGGGTVCYGDSGGPAFAADTGALLGVYSRITGDCFAAESRNTYVRVSALTSVMDRAFAMAGETPTLETTEATVGESGDPAAEPAGAPPASCSARRTVPSTSAVLPHGMLALLALAFSLRLRAHRSACGDARSRNARCD